MNQPNQFAGVDAGATTVVAQTLKAANGTGNPLIPRCKWCIARIGKPSYRVDGEWQAVFSVHHLLGDVNFSDGICPDCLTLEKAKILKQNHE
jgi:hypothetical protein